MKILTLQRPARSSRLDGVFFTQFMPIRCRLSPCLEVGRVQRDHYAQNFHCAITFNGDVSKWDVCSVSFSALSECCAPGAKTEHPGFVYLCAIAPSAPSTHLYPLTTLPTPASHLLPLLTIFDSKVVLTLTRVVGTELRKTVQSLASAVTGKAFDAYRRAWHEGLEKT